MGRGAWAGPVTVGAVVPAPEHLRGVRDSKQLTRPERERAARRCGGWAVAVGIGHASHEECDELGMTAALRAAAMRALAQLEAQGYVPDRIVLDGKHDYLGLGDAAGDDRDQGRRLVPGGRRGVVRGEGDA